MLKAQVGGYNRLERLKPCVGSPPGWSKVFVKKSENKDIRLVASKVHALDWHGQEQKVQRLWAGAIHIHTHIYTLIVDVFTICMFSTVGISYLQVKTSDPVVFTFSIVSAKGGKLTIIFTVCRECPG